LSSAALAYPIKSADAFRTISEVAADLDVPQHVLRFWESRFTQIKPVKRAGGRRYYRPEDVDLLRGIRALLYGDGLTIRGVQKVLRDRGPRHVAAIGRGAVFHLRPVTGQDDESPEDEAAFVSKPESMSEVHALHDRIEAAHAEPPAIDPSQAKIESLLAELVGLKSRLRASRARAAAA
jgi:DNA-binding transcriptional MerR regulator